MKASVATHACGSWNSEGAHLNNNALLRACQTATTTGRGWIITRMVWGSWRGHWLRMVALRFPGVNKYKLNAHTHSRCAVEIYTVVFDNWICFIEVLCENLVRQEFSQRLSQLVRCRFGRGGAHWLLSDHFSSRHLHISKQLGKTWVVGTFCGEGGATWASTWKIVEAWINFGLSFSSVLTSQSPKCLDLF